jgi:D-alanyl-lipoteichoic acid acyltransferase DltB (MBOAT superfamily)
MLYNSYVFIFLFLPSVILLYSIIFYLFGGKATQLLLIFSSLLFYGYWELSYLWIISCSVVTNFLFAKLLISKKTERKATNKLLFIAVLSNIFILGYFKYADFLILNINIVLSADFNFLSLALPLAISFFTIQQIAFLVDCHYGLVKKVQLIDYSLFILFFPQLIAGPIVRYRESFEYYLASNLKQLSGNNLIIGLSIFGFGLFKKVVIADSFMEISNFGYLSAASLGYFDTLIYTTSYSLQMYFDFSGYSDMAFGLAVMFGIKIPYNFLSPYRATSIIDFWKKWHISLTSFITNYIYNPILFYYRRMDLFTTSAITVFAFTVSGIWHGANWNYIFWGIMHGLAVSINHVWIKNGIKINKYISWFITMYFINLTFVIFKNTSFESIKISMQKLFFIPTHHPRMDHNYNELLFSNEIFLMMSRYFGGFITVLFLYVLSSVFIAANLNTKKLYDSFQLNYKQTFLYITLLFIGVFSISKQVEFLYFVF